MKNGSVSIDGTEVLTGGISEWGEISVPTKLK